MPILEKIVRPEDAKHWKDSIPLEFHYTAGVAGEAFLRELKDHARLLASKCPKCKSSYVPARMYCPTCFVEMKERHAITGQGSVYSLTIVNEDRNGKRLDKPAVVGLIKFENVKGGLVHLLDVDGPGRASIGMRVKPVFKDADEREGSLNDIVGFRPE